MRHRTGSQLHESNESSSSDDDAFSAFSRKKNKKKIAQKKKGTSSKLDPPASDSTSRIESVCDDADDPAAASSNETSSNKRHHFHNEQRAARMDALIQELQDTKNTSNHQRKRFPDKMGSYVLPGEEHSTTNIFVGNLSPLTTEEQLTEVFRQFGELYSIKIMWPRTPEEQARGRNTGFVCFMNRDDAQDAMHALQDADPLNTGRRMFLNWGKNVKKMPNRVGVKDAVHAESDSTRRKSSIGNFTEDRTMQTGLISVGSEKTAHLSHRNDDHSIMGSNMKKNRDDGNVTKYNPDVHEADAIRVKLPSHARLKVISTVASFVAKDGSILEKKLIEKKNPSFAFLLPSHNEEDGEDHDITEIKIERIYYRWRVYSFCQGDGLDTWRTEPFQIIHPNGRFWIPPPIDPRAIFRKNIESELRQEQQLIKHKRRRQFSTGRQMENAKLKNDGSRELSLSELKHWRELFGKLCGSKESICKAMAFCFDNSGAANQISKLLEEGLLDNRDNISIETKCARLFLMSDVLFNSQQPGVKNAFRYRDSIERMAPNVFRRLGQHGNVNVGRIRMSKLRNAVKLVLSAWNSWDVYPGIFLDQLEALFEGKPMPEAVDSNSNYYGQAPLCSGERDRNSEEEKVGITASNSEGLHHPRSVDVSQKSIWMINNIESESNVDEDVCNRYALKNENEIENVANLVDEELDGESLGESEMANSVIELDNASLQFDEISVTT